MKRFHSYEAYEAWTETFEDPAAYEMEPVAIDDGWKISMDMFTECKSFKTALRRFEKIFRNVDADAGVSEWIEGIRESCQNGFFKDAMTMWDKAEEQRIARTFGSYSWGVEEIDDGLWYIFLNVSGQYAGRPERAA